MATATDDGGGDCYLCGGLETVEDADTGENRPCPACRPDEGERK